jgi:hypothetical protein
MSTNNLIIILRGHIRNSFTDNKLYDLIKEISQNYNILIYIHTWNIQQSNISWRPIDKIDNIITNELINNYFIKTGDKDLSLFIKNIIIEDDKNIKLNGNLEGIIGAGCPILGWKRYIYSLYQITNYVRNFSNNEFIINLRFDIFSNSNNITKNQILELINNNYNIIFKKNIFIYDTLTYGIDNVICGNSETMYKLFKYFNENLDYIISKNKSIKNQEFLLFLENELIF